MPKGKPSSKQRAAKAAGGGTRGGGSRLLTLGVTDERITTVPRALQAAKTFVLRTSCPLGTSISGTMTMSPLSPQPYMPLLTLMGATVGWTALIQPNYDQFFLAEFAVRFVPCNRYSKVTTLTGAVVLVYDVDSTSVSPTESAALDYGTAKVISLDDPAELRYAVPMDTTSGRSWIDVALLSTLPGCIAFATPPTASTTPSIDYGQLYFELVVTARGRR